MKKFNPKDFEDKWKKKWAEEQIYKTPEIKKGDAKAYILDMYPYPSGSGLHVGHPRGYLGTDVVARFNRMQDKKVMHPIGFDSFGLPAENYAIKTGTPPEKSTNEAIDYFKKQIDGLGLSYDWDRELMSHDPEFMKWNQWLFLEMYKKGLAYLKEAPVNWCPKDQTVLANEQVESDGTCERCGTEVIQKNLKQWFFKITDFADRLIDDLDKIDWPESTKLGQKNWIGRSEGAEINFKLRITNSEEEAELKVFTTRPDTIFGATFMVIAPEHLLIKNEKLRIKNYSEVEEYVKKAGNKTELERQQQKDKTGVEIKGIVAINPFNNQEIPIYVADYVLGGYGTGAIMAVPAHDERDFEFAQKYNIDITKVIEGEELPVLEDNKHINSDFLDGLNKEDAIKKIISEIKERGIGQSKTTYKLRDWLVSRQRYWGCPIPVVYRALNPEEKELQIKYNKQPDFVLQLHAWGSSPDRSFHKYIDSELSKLSINSSTPNLPNPKNPNREEWHQTAMELVEESDTENIVIIGRSLGCTSALKIAEDKVIRKLILVAPTSPINQQKDEKALSNNELDISESEHKVLVDFVGLEDGVIDFDKVNKNVGEVVIYLSSNDPYIPEVETRKYFSERLEKVRFIKKENANHFTNEAGYSEFPELIEEIVRSVNIEIVPLKEEDLPLRLPTDVDYNPKGKSPLASSESFKKQAEEKYGKGWHYEVDTMDTFVDSSWYFFRFTDPHNKEKFADEEEMNKWLPVDLYVGGAEHTVLHLMYARFFTKFLFDEGYVDFDEPFQKLRHQGMILAEDSRKMSKRWGNTIDPNDEIDKFGADTLRVYEMFMGPFDSTMPWDTKAEIGVSRFLSKVWDNFNRIQTTDSREEKQFEIQEREINKLIKYVGPAIESMSFNTAVAKMMEFNNLLTKEKEIDKSVFERFMLVLAPFAPFITEEIWSELGNEFSIHNQKWPEFDEALTKESSVTIAIQINGKVRGTVEVDAGSDEDTVYKAAMEIDSIAKYVETEPKKRIYVMDRILNVIV